MRFRVKVAAKVLVIPNLIEGIPLVSIGVIAPPVRA